MIDPAGQILHDGCVQEEMFPIEVDLELVRRQRRRGILNMGQPAQELSRQRDLVSYLRSRLPLGLPRLARAVGEGRARAINSNQHR